MYEVRHLVSSSFHCTGKSVQSGVLCVHSRSTLICTRTLRMAHPVWLRLTTRKFWHNIALAHPPPTLPPTQCARTWSNISLPFAATTQPTKLCTPSNTKHNKTYLTL